MIRHLLVLALGACGTADSTPRLVAEDARSISIHSGSTVVLTDTGLEMFNTAVLAPGELVLPPAREVVRGDAHACALSTSDTVHCWGDQSRGALGEHRSCLPPIFEDGEPDCRLGPAVMAMLPPTRALAAGAGVTCAISFDDRVVCWGDPALLGGSRLPALDPPTPVLVDGEPLAAVRVIIHQRSICAIAFDGALWCWGEGFERQPVRQPETGVIDVALGPFHRCVIDDTGLHCSGTNFNGQLGDPDHARACETEGSCELKDHAIPLAAERVVVGLRHTCVLTTDGEVICFGSNELGQLGRNDAFLIGEPAGILDDIVELESGRDHACARGRDGFAYCWGAFGSEVTP